MTSSRTCRNPNRVVSNPIKENIYLFPTTLFEQEKEEREISPAATPPVLRVHLGVRWAGHGADAARCRTRRAGRERGLLVDGRPVRCRWILNPGIVVIVVQMVQLQPSVVRMEQTGASRLLRRGCWTRARRAARRGRCLFFGKNAP